MTVPLLGRSLAHVDALLASAAPGFALSFADYNLIDLPVYRGGQAANVTPEAMRTLATLYFLAELEGTHMISVAEELATARFSLNLRDTDAAQKLDDLVRAMQGNWLNRDLRNQIFLRTFGLGFADPALGDGAVNREFEPRFASLCAAIERHGQERAMGAVTGETVTRVGYAAQLLLTNLGGRVQGNTLVVAGHLTGQIKQAIAVLNHPGMAAVFMARDAWDVIRAVLGPDTPDLQGPVNRAQTGLRLFSWMAEHIHSLSRADAAAALAAEPDVIALAQRWLLAAGIANPGYQIPAQPARQMYQPGQYQ